MSRKRNAEEMAGAWGTVGSGQALKRATVAITTHASNDTEEDLGESITASILTAPPPRQALDNVIPPLNLSGIKGSSSSSCSSSSSSAAAAANPASFPPSVKRLLSVLFPAVPKYVLTSRLIRPVALDAFKPPPLTPAELVAREAEKREVALRRNAARVASTSARVAAKRAREAVAASSSALVDDSGGGGGVGGAGAMPVPPSSPSSLLGLASLLRGGGKPPAQAGISKPTTQLPPPPAAKAETLPPAPPHRRKHGWGTSAAMASAATGHWRTATYALTVGACGAGVVSSSKGSGAGSVAAASGRSGGGIGSFPAASLADVKRAEMETQRAQKGWVDPSLTSRQNHKLGKLGALQQQQVLQERVVSSTANLPPSLPGGVDVLPAVLATNGGALPRKIKWVGAPVTVVRGGVEGRVQHSKQPPLIGTVVWVGRTYFTLRLKGGGGGGGLGRGGGEEGGGKSPGKPHSGSSSNESKGKSPTTFLTLLKVGCLLKVQWPVRIAPQLQTLAVEVCAESMREGKAWV